MMNLRKQLKRPQSKCKYNHLHPRLMLWIYLTLEEVVQIPHLNKLNL
jgi:hypothetical protein